MELPPLSPVSPPSLPRRVHFDEQGYLQLHPDIASGVANGAISSGWAHFVQHGHKEGRKWVPRVDSLTGISREVSPADEMFHANEEHYFDVGASALHCIETALLAARRPRDTITRILDLPCGHGRVLRFLRHAFPEAEVVACDLNRDGVDFCARVFGAVPLYSHEDIDLVPHEGVVDLIWCGSLLTHLTEEKCHRLLRFFHRILGHGGILVFTTHGRFCARKLEAGGDRHGLGDPQIQALLRDYRDRGFAHVGYSAQGEYGFSLANPGFVMRRFIDEVSWRLLGYHENGWDGRQDVVAVQKSLNGNSQGI